MRVLVMKWTETVTAEIVTNYAPHNQILLTGSIQALFDQLGITVGIPTRIEDLSSLRIHATNDILAAHMVRHFEWRKPIGEDDPCALGAAIANAILESQFALRKIDYVQNVVFEIEEE